MYLSSSLGALLTGDIVVGGESDPSDRYIAPTVIDNVGWDDAIMEDEIFGPILPVIAYDNLDRVIERLEAWPKPLALYVFSTSRATQEKLLGRIPSGGACINDVLSQMGNVRLPFGGVGQSGIGAYHGKTGFDTFSHARGIVWRANWWDPRIRYAPYWIPVAALRRLLPFLY